ncbi:MAG: nucleoside hydrolase, partial [Pseudoflavonifractor sp.]
DPAVGVDPRHGVEVLRDLLLAAPGKVTIAALGPLTNLALLLRTYPEVAEKIELVSMMGGGLTHGNMTATAEFNLYVDPEAAQIVFSDRVPIAMSGLDVTEQVTILPAEYAFLRQKGFLGEFFCDMMDFYGRGSAFFNSEGCVMHDPCALAYLLAPQLFDGPRGNVTIPLFGSDRGRTVLTEHKDGNTQVFTHVDAPGTAKVILDAISLLCAHQA